MEEEKNKNLITLGDLTDTRQSNIGIKPESSIDINSNKLSNNALKLKNLEDKMNSLEVTYHLK
jgi:hypothetical protein